jgi:alpha-galactosidase
VTTRITIVGGGSTHWTPKLLVDFANTPGLTDVEVVLTDIDAASLAPNVAIGKHIAAERAIGMNVTAATSIEQALDGTQFVITAFSVGGFASMVHDLEIPASYGIYQPVGDSVGPGGISRSLRSIPVLVDMARSMERHSPDALLLNVSNPLTALCRAVTSQTKVKTVGLCNELVGLQFWLSLVFDVGMKVIDPVVAGVNHCPVVTSLRIGDNDGFAMLRDVLNDPAQLEGQPVWMAPPQASHWKKIDPGRDWTKADILFNNRLKLEILERFGVLPGSADTHVAEFFPWFVTALSDNGRRWGVHHYGLAGHREDKVDDDSWAHELEAGGKVSTWPSGELVAPLIDSIVNHKVRHLPVNLPNRGQVHELPADVVVECIGTIGAEGVHARDVAGPGALGEHIRRVVTSQELTVEAALTGDRAKVIQAMLADPMAGTLPMEHAVAMTEELLSACAPWLPQFA